MLLQVGHEWVLQMPQGIGNPHERVWLMAGGVVDASDPYIAHAIKGQEHKFQPAPQGAKPSEIPPVLIQEREQWMRTTPPPTKTETKAAEATKIAAATGSTLGIEAPSIGKKPKATAGS